MEQSTQSASQQQGRQQPVYDTRNGGHYGKLPSSLTGFFLHLVSLGKFLSTLFQEAPQQTPR